MKVTFCGLGALGSHTVLLCRALDVDLAGVDFDRVESKNTLSQVYSKQTVGRNKAEATKLQLLNFFGRAFEAYPVRIETSNVDAVCGGSGLLVDCFDNGESRRVLSRYSAANGVPLVHAGISGDGSFGLVRWEDRFVPDDEDTPGQATCQNGEHLPMIGLVAANLASVVRDFVVTGDRRDVTVTSRGIAKST